MSKSIQLTLACGSYDINQGLIDGSVKPQGIDLTVLTYPSPQRHWRMLVHQEFDICELSMASYLLVHSRGSHPFIAIPAFPHRRFRHSYIFINSESGIRTAKDLEGRKVGLRTWQTTAGLWMRGILQDEYGVDLKKVQWFTQDQEDIPFTPPPGISIQLVPEGKTVTGMLETGELDALIYPELPEAIKRGDPRVKRLFDDYKQEEIRYFKKTGFFPIMHTVVIKNSVLEKYPWAAVNMLEAFRKSKDLAFKKMEDPRKISLAWVRELIEEQKQVLGNDPWCYNLPDNRDALNTMIRWSYEQGMSSRMFPAEELFFPPSLDELPQYV